tara:strand:+ start:7337 stop:8698 length:1362 start_codon:yes stop_codon:yes gene_type:complete
MKKKKIQSAFFCQNCGVQSPKWLGKCPNCKEWNTYVEEIINKEDSKSFTSNSKRINTPSLIKDLSELNEERIITNDLELNRVLGGGIVPGSVVLLGGEPGIGKSTLLLQIALNIKKKVLYVSGEESESQIKMRAKRIIDSLKTDNCFILTETNTQNIFTQIETICPNILIIDSIQTLHTNFVESSPGSVSQIRECTSELIKYAKMTNTAILLIGHINKDGALAGPKILEHMVDTVLQFEGDRNHIYRILRSIKNRFGSASELGVYEMVNNGLRQVNNPSEILISQRDDSNSGVSISTIIEGNRPLMIEVQSLVSSAVYGTPQRSATGFDLKRLNMLLAVLEKRCGFKLAIKDVFLNITGGIKPDDTAIDLAVICSILSSDLDIPISNDTCFAGEVGLSGEIRAVNRVERRVSEAQKLGYKNMIISKYSKLNNKNFSIKIYKFEKIEEVLSLLF